MPVTHLPTMHSGRPSRDLGLFLYHSFNPSPKIHSAWEVLFSMSANIPNNSWVHLSSISSIYSKFILSEWPLKQTASYRTFCISPSAHTFHQSSYCRNCDHCKVHISSSRPCKFCWKPLRGFLQFLRHKPKPYNCLALTHLSSLILLLAFLIYMSLHQRSDM